MSTINEMPQSVEDCFILTASEVDLTLRERLLDKARQLREKKCHPVYGYIERIDALEAIVSNTILPYTAGHEFRVRYRAKVLSPRKGHVIRGAITIIGQRSLLIDLGAIRIAVPLQDFPNYRIEDGKLIADNGTFRKGDVIQVRITHVRTLNNKIDCTATIM